MVGIAAKYAVNISHVIFRFLRLTESLRKVICIG